MCSLSSANGGLRRRFCFCTLCADRGGCLETVRSQVSSCTRQAKRSMEGIWHLCRPRSDRPSISGKRMALMPSLAGVEGSERGASSCLSFWDSFIHAHSSTTSIQYSQRLLCEDCWKSLLHSFGDLQHAIPLHPESLITFFNRLAETRSLQVRLIAV
jgi:hypothetical protein